MKMQFCTWLLAIAATVIMTVTGMAECPSEPVFDEATFLLLPDIQEFNLDFALQWTDSAAGIFIQPFDALILHLDTEGTLWDVYIFSDVGMNRLTAWVCTSGENRFERELLSITEYRGEDADGFIRPSGLATNAIGRIFDPLYDMIYLADRGNDRIVEIGLEPDLKENRCRLFFVGSFGSEVLEWPIDIAVAIYGPPERDAESDFYVIDWGHERNAGSLIRFDVNGQYEYSTGYVCHPHTGDTLFAIARPMSVACLTDTAEGRAIIYVSEADAPLIFGLRSYSVDPPQFYTVQGLRTGRGFWEPGGIAIDDFGRIYIANRAAQIIENYGPGIGCYYLKIGEGWEPGSELCYPSNIIIDTFHGFCEFLVIEKYFRQSGLRTFVMSSQCGMGLHQGGFARNNKIVPPVQVSQQLPMIFALNDAYPNPFNYECKLGFSLPYAERVSIEVFDVLGRMVTKLLDQTLPAGHHSVTFNARGLSSGTYMYKMTAGRFSKSKQIVLVK